MCSRTGSRPSCCWATSSCAPFRICEETQLAARGTVIGQIKRAKRDALPISSRAQPTDRRLVPPNPVLCLPTSPFHSVASSLFSHPPPTHPSHIQTIPCSLTLFASRMPSVAKSADALLEFGTQILPSGMCVPSSRPGLVAFFEHPSLSLDVQRLPGDLADPLRSLSCSLFLTL